MALSWRTILTILGTRILPLAGLVGSLAAVGQCLYLWDATGRRWFTQYHDPALIPAPPDELDALLTQAGAFDQGRTPDIDNEFRFGLLPSGLNRFAVSALTVGGPAILSIPVCLVAMRRRS
jgi:hypothetical protein